MLRNLVYARVSVGCILTCLFVSALIAQRAFSLINSSSSLCNGCILPTPSTKIDGTVGSVCEGSFVFCVTSLQEHK